MEIDEILKEKREEILAIANRNSGRKVQIFGPIARGEGKRDSDIDLLVELESGRSLFDIIAIKQNLEDLLKRREDVVTEAAVSPYIRKKILSHAINL